MKSAATRRSPEATLGATVAHPLRCRCLAVLADRVASPAEIARELGLEVSSVGYHVTALGEAGLIEEVGQRPVRGAVEHFYKAVVRPITTTEEEADLSIDKRLSFARTIWSLIAANATLAIEAGTLVERPEHHLTRVPLRVDEEGWLELADAYMELYERVYKIHEKSVGRLGGNAEDPGISVLSILAFFETPEDPPTADFSAEAAGADQPPEELPAS